MNEPLNWEALSAKWCERCGKRIPDERRRAEPGVQHCHECQGVEDRAQVRRQQREESGQ